MNQRLITIIGSSLAVLLVGLGVWWFATPSPNPPPNRNQNAGTGDTGPGSAKDSTVNNIPPRDVPWLEQLASSDAGVRRKALGKFDDHKEEAANSIPVLLGKLAENDPATRSALSDVLARLGTEKGPAGKDGAEAVRAGLVAALGQDDAARTVAALSLGKLGWANEAAISGLQKGLLSKDKALQRVSALALRKLLSTLTIEVSIPEGVDSASFAGHWLRITHQKYVNSEDTVIVAPLVEALQDPDPMLQLWAAEIFAVYADTIPNSPDALPALTQLFKGEDKEVALLAARGLGKICLLQSTTAGTLLSALGDSNAVMRSRAAAALSGAVRQIGLKEPYRYQVPLALQTPDAIAALIRALEDPGKDVRGQAIDTLGWIGPPAAKALPALVKVANSTDEKSRRLAAFSAIGTIARQSATVVPELLNSLKDSDPDIKKAAIAALTSCGKEAVPELKKNLDTDNADVRSGVIQALGAIGPAADDALTDLKPLLKAESILTRVLTASAILRIEPTNKASLPVLKTALAEKSLPGRDALEAIRPLGPVAAGLTPEIAVLLEAGDKGVAWRAADVLVSIGPGAVAAAPALAAVLKKCPDTGRNQERISLDSDEFLSQRAIDALLAIGPEAKIAADALVGVLAKCKDPAAADALSLLDPKQAAGIEVLLEASRSPFDNVREMSLRALGRLGPTASDAVPGLVKRMVSEPSFASPIKETLVRLGPVAVPALKAALADKPQRLHALEVLGRIGTQDKSAATAMLQASEGVDTAGGLLALTGLGEIGIERLLEAAKTPEQSLFALRALATLEGRAATAVKPLTELLQDKKFPEKAELLRTLAAIGPAAKTAATALKETLKETNEEVQAAAAFALVRVAGDTKTAGPILVRLLKEAKNREARRDAARGLGLTPTEVQDSLPLLQELLKDQAFDLREVAAEALGNLGEAASKAFPDLIKAASDSEPVVQVAACRALVKVGPTREAVAALQSRLKDRDLVRVAAIEGLGKLGPAARGALPDLRVQLELIDEAGIVGDEQKTALARALWQIEGKKALPEVLQVLQGQLNALTYGKALAEAIDVLNELGPDARDLVPLLIPRTDSIYQAVRRSTAQTLGKIGPAAKPALPWLQRAVTHESDEELKRHAKEAIAAIGPKS